LCIPRPFSGVFCLHAPFSFGFALSRFPWQVSLLVLVTAFLRFGGGPSPLQWGLGCLHGRSPLLPQGHASNQQCRSGQPTKTGRDRAGRRERAIPPSTGDCSAQPRMRRGVRAAVRRPVQRHLLMAPTPGRRALERLCGHPPSNDHARRARQGSRTGKVGRRSSERVLSFSCFNSSRR
jgi:hypothetical protein